MSDTTTNDVLRSRLRAEAEAFNAGVSRMSWLPPAGRPASSGGPVSGGIAAIPAAQAARAALASGGGFGAALLAGLDRGSDRGGGARTADALGGGTAGTASGSGITDERVRLRPLNPGDFYGRQPGIMHVLQTRTSGLLFPYTPSVQFSQSVDYAQLGLVHSIGDILAFQRTPSVEITVSGKITVQNALEGEYAMGCLHFCRVASKMRFGQQDPRAGLPPPMLLLSGYGTYMFNDLRCVLKSHTWSFDESSDLVSVAVRGGRVRLPPVFTLSVTVMVQNTPAQMRTQFNMERFRSGAQVAGGGWI